MYYKIIMSLYYTYYTQVEDIDVLKPIHVAGTKGKVIIIE